MTRSQHLISDLPAMVVQGRHVEVLTALIDMVSDLIEGVNLETERSDRMMSTIQSISGHIRTLYEEKTKLQGRELYMCSDGIIWHREDDRMIPLTDAGDHVDPDAWHNRGSIEVRRMRKRESFPTLRQLQDINKGPLKPVTELDVVRRHVTVLEARLAGMEGQVPGA